MRLHRHIAMGGTGTCLSSNLHSVFVALARVEGVDGDTGPGPWTQRACINSVTINGKTVVVAHRATIRKSQQMKPACRDCLQLNRCFSTTTSVTSSTCMYCIVLPGMCIAWNGGQTPALRATRSIAGASGAAPGSHSRPKSASSISDPFWP